MKNAKRRNPDRRRIPRSQLRLQFVFSDFPFGVVLRKRNWSAEECRSAAQKGMNTKKGREARGYIKSNWDTGVPNM